MGIKAVTIRLTDPVYEKLCKVAGENEEFPSEAARRILRENLTDTNSDSADKVIDAEIVPDEEVIEAEVIEEDVIVAEVIPDGK